MRILLYLCSLLLALPCVLFAAGILAVGHMAATGNLFKIVYHFFLAFGYGVPVVFWSLIAFLLAAFWAPSRLVAGVILVVMNVVALVIIVASPARPRELAETVFLLPALFSTVMAAMLVVDHVRPRGAAGSPAAGPSVSGPASTT